MSSGETHTEAAEAGVAKKKGILPIIVVGLVMLGVGSAGTWLILRPAAEDEPVAKAKPVPKSPPTFFTLEPFVVNLAGEAQHYLQVGIDLKVADEHVKDQIKTHLPEIRNGVLLLLSGKQVEELASLEGKNLLRAQIREAVNRPLGIDTPAPRAAPRPEGEQAHSAQGEPADSDASGMAAGESGEEPAEGVLDVLLTSFVIQ
jgi:flagellar FliL protein